jgi:hypothetical protein
LIFVLFADYIAKNLVSKKKTLIKIRCKKNKPQVYEFCTGRIQMVSGVWEMTVTPTDFLKKKTVTLIHIYGNVFYCIE